jgi:hypothetical protein
MSVWKQYRLLWITLGMIAVITLLSFLTRIPTQGAKEWSRPQVTFSFGYFGAGEAGSVTEWVKEAKNTSFFAAPDRLFAENPQAPLANFYPVFDASNLPESINLAYPTLPAEMLAGYGRTVYTFDYGNARFLFLNGERLDDPKQTEWLQATVNNAKQVHNIVLLAQEPTDQKLWDVMKDSGINLVLVQDSVYALDHVVAQQSAEYKPSPYQGWGVWQVASQIGEPHMLLIEGNENKLFVSAQDRDGNGLDRLEEDVSKLVFTNPLDERVAVGIESVWRFTPGRGEIKAVIPEGFDVTGEHPITQPFNLPPDDWRHPQYEDAAWQIGRAPFGHTKTVRESRERIETRLPVDPASPSYYFRKTFVLEDDPAQIEDLLLHIAFEDGFIAYLNGEEIYRDAIRTGLVQHSTLAETNEWTFYRRIPIKNQIPRLVKGVNTLAVEVHRAHPKAPNLFFDLSLSYEKKAGEAR